MDGKPVNYEIEVKATLIGKDVTQILTANHIDIQTFGHFVDTGKRKRTAEQPATKDFDKLPQSAKDQLIKAGLFEDEGEGFVRALWTVQVQYHWTLAFPAHSTVHIRHEYKPVKGAELMLPDTLKNVYGHKQPTGDADTVKDALQDMRLTRGALPRSLILGRHDYTN